MCNVAGVATAACTVPGAIVLASSVDSLISSHCDVSFAQSSRVALQDCRQCLAAYTVRLQENCVIAAAGIACSTQYNKVQKSLLARDTATHKLAEQRCQVIGDIESA
eukprot:6312-Heterococcus_DN1.PRE.2